MHEVFEKIAKGELTKDDWEEWSLQEQHCLYDLAAAKFPRVKDVPTKVTADCKEIFDLLFDRDPVFNPLEAGNKIIDDGIEHKFEFDVPGTPARVKGFIDLLVELDEDTLEVLDWKTGSWTLSYKDARQDPQVLIYYLAARHLFPQYKFVLVTLDYLRRKPVTLPLDDKCIAGTKRSLTKYWRLIKNNNDPKRWETPIWVCDRFCDRAECDKLWDIYVSQGGLEGFTEYMDAQFEEKQAQLEENEVGQNEEE
jgi:hypothetical protein